MQKNHLTLAVLAGGALLLTACQTSPPPAAPAQSASPINYSASANMASNCFACHGPDGRSPGAIPSIHGWPADAIARAVKDFKAGTRPSTVMGRHAKGYSDAEIEAVSNYIAGLK